MYNADMGMGYDVESGNSKRLSKDMVPLALI
jgi:hypothetical protein